MLEPARWPDGSAAGPPLRWAGSPFDIAALAEHPLALRRGSAESFRALAARLAKPASAAAASPPAVPLPAAESDVDQSGDAAAALTDVPLRNDRSAEYRVDTNRTVHCPEQLGDILETVSDAPGDGAGSAFVDEPERDAMEAEGPIDVPVAIENITDRLDTVDRCHTLQSPPLDADSPAGYTALHVPELPPVAPPPAVGPIGDGSPRVAEDPGERTLPPVAAPMCQPPGDSAGQALAARSAQPLSLLRRRSTEGDPFAAAMPAPPHRIHVTIPVEIEEPDPQAGDVARSLLDIMSAPPSSVQPQERALAGDTLLRLVPRIPLGPLMALVERVCMMDAPPALLVSRLIRDPRPEVAGPLLEKGIGIGDQDLLSVIEEGDEAKQRMIARRRLVSTALADALVAQGAPSVLLTLTRNPGASLSHDAFHRLCGQARGLQALQAPLATRADTPAPVAFELFWVLPAELRRLILSRFLAESETLSRILKIALSVGEVETAGRATDARCFEKSDFDTLVHLLAEGRNAEAAQLVAARSVTCEANALRIIGDAGGEPLTVLFKVIGLTRARFAETLEQLRISSPALPRESRNISELQSIFDKLSFNKARVLLTYWDWASRKSGPYAACAA